MANDTAPSHPLAHAELGIEIEPGVYHCDACIAQHDGSSPEFPVMFTRTPIGLCSEHPANAGFTKVAELAIPREMEIPAEIEDGRRAVRSGLVKPVEE